jgi:hypothetical protein
MNNEQNTAYSKKQEANMADEKKMEAEKNLRAVNLHLK